MAIFQVYNRDTRAVVLETDDWVLAQHRALKWPLTVRGTHPSHDWGPPHEGQGDRITRRCRNCDGWDNGSYGSQSPCDYDWNNDSLVSAIEREMAARA